MVANNTHVFQVSVLRKQLQSEGKIDKEEKEEEEAKQLRLANRQLTETNAALQLQIETVI